ncbi:unnamed protein product [Gongylonema pulchrum]|uniref:Presenilin n=1 Tax=Gongylonema pulchrum TaxID=637853 RepID=A0A183DTD7_9BILA|nr:unnamed protein product [Gongylonema pulchrum]
MVENGDDQTQQDTSGRNISEHENRLQSQESRTGTQEVEYLPLHLIFSASSSMRQQQQQQQHSRRPDGNKKECEFVFFSEASDEEEEMELKYGAQHVIHLFIPVSICMAFVIFTMNTVGYYTRKDGQYLIYTPFTKETDDTGEKIMMSLGNAFIILGVVIFMTVLLIILYKFRFYRVCRIKFFFSLTVLRREFLNFFRESLQICVLFLEAACG